MLGTPPLAAGISILIGLILRFANTGAFWKKVRPDDFRCILDLARDRNILKVVLIASFARYIASGDTSRILK